MKAAEMAENEFYFVGERLCLDFVNTQAVDAGGDPIDLLGGYDDLVTWAASGQAIDAAQAKELTRAWGGTPAGKRAFDRAVAFRTMLRGMAERIAEGRSIPNAAVDDINEVLRTRGGALELTRTRDGYDTRFRQRIDEPEQLLVPIAESAAELLSSGDLTLVRKCQNPRCILYFYDTTKNHGRRWCSMNACGNRAKVAAHYRRARE
jgi:predicted RNA-binding Zn ribbon-like protein